MSTDNTLQIAVNHAISDYRASRLRASMLGGYGADAKRKSTAWIEYGFPDHLDFEDFYSLYRRGGIAHGAVNKLVSACWKTQPWIIEGDDQDGAKKETQWERSLKPLLKGGKLWRAFAEADKRRLIGRYSGLILQLKDGKKWDEPVMGRPALAKLIPAWAGSLIPTAYDNDPQSQRYGEPTAWQYTEAASNGSSGRQIKIHPDRVFILGDYSSDAIGFLEPAYNAFVSLEKVEGGSGESFLKNAARQLAVSFDKEVDLGSLAAMYGVPLADLTDRFNEAAREMNRGNDVMLMMQGATTTPLVSNVPDPTPTYNVNLQTVSAALDIPTRILVGNQSGERSSTEDQRYFYGRCQSRRGELSAEITDLLEHLMRIRVVTAKAEFTPMWDDLTEATPMDRLASAKTMAEINSTGLSTGEVFTGDEIREAAGYDPDETGTLGEDDDGEDPEGANPAVDPE